MSAPPWDFHYAPAPGAARGEARDARELIIAGRAALSPDAVAAALGPATVTVERLIDRAPIHWLRVRSGESLELAEVERRLRVAGIEVRYVASASEPSQRLPPRLGPGAAACAEKWRPRAAPLTGEPAGEGGWYLGERGLRIDRALCGYGSGTRVALIDNDGGKTDCLGLDALVPVGREPPDPRRHARHGACMVAWAVGAADVGFAGVAPGASARLYCIPKPGAEVYTLALAIVRAVDDGADVVGCATYVDGTTSPMLDDALTFAASLGRQGLGTPVVLAASREMSSPDGLVRASLSLDLGDPASDPRVMCAAPSGRAGAWFLWRDKAGDLQPFANRGPAVRFMAPGDDVADPFAPGRLAHAESSGATAFAVGVVALVLAIHPELRASELDALWMVSTQRIDPRRDLEQAGRDETAASELRPLASDDDGHNAKHGYGRLDATAACLAATDPVAQQLLRMGERAAAQRWGRRAPWAGLLRAATVRALSRHVLIGPARSHPLATLLRHLRLVAQKPDRAAAHAPGSLIRQLALCAGALAASCPAAADELIALEERLRTLSGDSAERERVEEAVTNMVTSAFAPPALGPPRRPAASGHPPQLPA